MGVKSLLHSRKAAIVVIDGIVTLILYFVGKYSSPNTLEDLKIIIAVMQPIFVMWIGSIAYEDGKKLQGGGTPGK